MTTRTLAEFAATVKFDDIPANVVDAAQRCIVDTVGVMIAGAGTDVAKVMHSFATRRGIARAPGNPLRLSGPADTAAVLYATNGHALDFDDGLPGAAHASVPVLGAILGATTGRALDAQRLIEAFVVGWEVVARVTRALGTEHYRRGWHTTGTAGTFGATAAACRVGGLSSAATATAFGIAGSLASGLRRNFGTMTKPLHSGVAAGNGVICAELAESGLTASPDVLDGAHGFLDLFGAADSQPSALESPGSPYALVDPGVITKAYPCCYATARGVDAMLRLRPTVAFSQVDSIDCVGPIGSFVALAYARPETELQAKFSMEYALAAALLDGAPHLLSFTDAAVRRPEARALVARTTVREEARCRPEDPTGTHSSPVAGGFVEVRIQLVDGTSRMARVEHAHGSPADPLSWAEIEAKFRACLASTQVPAADTDVLLARLRSTDHPDVFST